MFTIPSLNSGLGLLASAKLHDKGGQTAHVVVKQSLETPNKHINTKMDEAI